MPIDKMPKDKMPNDLLAFCLDFFVVIWHFVRLNFFWRFFADHVNMIWHFVRMTTKKDNKKPRQNANKSFGILSVGILSTYPYTAISIKYKHHER